MISFWIFFPFFQIMKYQHQDENGNWASYGLMENKLDWMKNLINSKSQKLFSAELKGEAQDENLEL